MSEQELFERIVASLHGAALGEASWTASAGLIDEACGTKGSALAFGDGRTEDGVELFYVRFCFGGLRRDDWEREYLEDYWWRDEGVPRLRLLPESRLVPVGELYTEAEKKTSAAYNEALPRAGLRDGLHARMDGPGGSRITWTVAEPVDRDGWGSARTGMIAALLPHVRQFVTVRHALAEAGALGTSLAGLLDATGVGVVQLDRRARIVAANDLARGILRRGDGLADPGGQLCAVAPAEDEALQRLLARALPPFGGQGASGSMMVSGTCAPARLVVHVSPVREGETGLRSRRVAALVLVVDPGRWARVDPELVAGALGLTPAESRIAVLLAEGRSIGDIAAATGRGTGTVRWHVKRIFTRHGLTRQVELVRLVLSLAGIAQVRR